MTSAELLERGSVLSLSGPSRLFRLLLCGGLAGGIAALVAGFSPGPCLFREVTGARCLTCGLSSSLRAFLSGDIVSSFHHHHLGPLFLAGVAGVFFMSLAEAVIGRTLYPRTLLRGHTVVLVSAASLWAVYGLFRMVLDLS